jgi:hypothetical protein
VNAPEPYELPPVSPRFAAGPGGFKAGPPKSFELPSRAAVADTEVATETEADAAGPRVAGGPQFGGSPIGPPVGAPGRRAARVAGVAAQLPGSFKTEWSLPAPKRWRRVRHALVRVLVLAIVVGGAYAAYPHVRTFITNRSVPADQRAYVGGHGVQYAPVGQHFAVRLPSLPAHRDSQVPAASGEPAMFVHRSIVSGADFEVVIRVADLAKGVALTHGLTGVLNDNQIAGPLPRGVHPTVFAGVSALDYTLASSPPTHARLFVRGAHVYVISVQSKAAGTVLDALSRSFRLLP